jgi:eukaryotic-like serine/threonine-protein kinase
MDCRWKSIVFQGIRNGVGNLFRIGADGSGKEENLSPGEFSGAPGAVSRDGKSLVFHGVGPGWGPDIFIMPLDGDHSLKPFLQTPAPEIHPKFSPDGAFLAYTSLESGRDEVYVRPLSGAPSNKWQISTDGGDEPVWSANGRELFFRTGNKMMVVGITAGANFAATPPRLLFEGSFDAGKAGTAGYDVSPDGQRFLMVQPTELEPPATQIHIVFNWLTELNERVPVKGH